MAKELISQSNTRRALRIIRRAFRAEMKVRDLDDYQFDFEHAGWFVTGLSTGAVWSVHDTADGVGFEQLCSGEDEV